MKTMIEVCNIIGINFELLCTHAVDMIMKALHLESKLSSLGKCKDGPYFKFNDDECILIDNRAEEIFLATRLLSLSYKIFAASKQELKNDIVKGKDNYPRTIVGVLNYLQFLNLNTNIQPRPTNQSKHQDSLETAFAIDGDKQPSSYNCKITVYKYFGEGTYQYKEEHM